MVGRNTTRRLLMGQNEIDSICRPSGGSLNPRCRSICRGLTAVCSQRKRKVTWYPTVTFDKRVLRRILAQITEYFATTGYIQILAVFRSVASDFQPGVRRVTVI